MAPPSLDGEGRLAALASPKGHDDHTTAAAWSPHPPRRTTMKTRDDIQRDLNPGSLVGEKGLKDFFVAPAISLPEAAAVQESVVQALEQAFLAPSTTTVSTKKSRKRKLQAKQQEQEQQTDTTTAPATSADLVVPPLPPAVDPRSYQKALLARAAKRNTIVWAGTGTGKTWIALLLIKQMQERLRQGQQAVFLVPSVALAVQQHATLAANLPCTTGLACAAQAWTQKFMMTTGSSKGRADVLVATHGAYLDLLLHSSSSNTGDGTTNGGLVASLDQVCLLILDECHHCIGNSPYAVLMRDFYHKLPVAKRPKVLGLTASPLISAKYHHSEAQLAQQLATLQQLMDATLASVSSLGLPPEDKDVLLLQRTAAEQVIPYDASYTLPATLRR